MTHMELISRWFVQCVTRKGDSVEKVFFSD